jgi:hypothetical protein
VDRGILGAPDKEHIYLSCTVLSDQDSTDRGSEVMDRREVWVRFMVALMPSWNTYGKCASMAEDADSIMREYDKRFPKDSSTETERELAWAREDSENLRIELDRCKLERDALLAALKAVMGDIEWIVKTYPHSTISKETEKLVAIALKQTEGT